MNVYLAFWNGKQMEIRAATLLDAKKVAVSTWGVPATKWGQVAVELVRRADGTDVVHVAVD